jgi:hypothetical protein
LHEILFISQPLQTECDAKVEDVSNKVMHKKNVLKAQKTKIITNNTYSNVEEMLTEVTMITSLARYSSTPKTWAIPPHTTYLGFVQS